MQVKIWRQKAMDRVEMAYITKEAKALRVLYRQVVTK